MIAILVVLRRAAKEILGGKMMTTAKIRETGDSESSVDATASHSLLNIQ